jgi:4,5-DOPA dioxygenase extradiol
MHSSLDAELNMKIGSSLAPLREEDEILIIGSGYTFHNMNAFFNPSEKTVKSSLEFNEWLKHTIMEGDNKGLVESLKDWDKAPGARTSHPREEHLLPLFMVGAAAGDDFTPKLRYDTTNSTSGNQLSEHAITGYIFQ